MSSTCHRFIATLLLTIGALLTTQTAGAVVRTWTFANVTFEDGGTLNGSFDFDADTDTYSNIDISVAGGDATFFSDFTYTDSNSSVLMSSNEKSLSLFVDLGLSNKRRLFMNFPETAPLTNDGGTVDVLNAIGFGGDSEFRTLPSSPPFGQRSFFTGGTVHAIPEPSSVLFMLALGLGAAAMIRRRRA